MPVYSKVDDQGPRHTAINFGMSTDPSTFKGNLGRGPALGEEISLVAPYRIFRQSTLWARGTNPVNCRRPTLDSSGYSTMRGCRNMFNTCSGGRDSGGDIIASKDDLGRGSALGAEPTNRKLTIRLCGTNPSTYGETNPGYKSVSLWRNKTWRAALRWEKRLLWSCLNGLFVS